MSTAGANYGGELRALQMAYRVAANGSSDPGPLYLYGCSFALNPAKTVASIVLPISNDAVILAVDLR
jgi:hypothetical protein